VSNEALEDKLVQKTLVMLRMARRVIEKLNADKDGEGFQEEPSLTDLVLVAQIIGQTSTLDRLGEMGMPVGSESPMRTLASPEDQAREPMEGAIAVGMPMMPDLIVMWSPDGWYVNMHPEFQQEARCCQSPEELATILQSMAVVCGQHRTPPAPPQELQELE
jgi:hypothetical protein